MVNILLTMNYLTGFASYMGEAEHHAEVNNDVNSDNSLDPDDKDSV